MLMLSGRSTQRSCQEKSARAYICIARTEAGSVQAEPADVGEVSAGTVAAVATAAANSHHKSTVARRHTIGGRIPGSVGFVVVGRGMGLHRQIMTPC